MTEEKNKVELENVKKKTETVKVIGLILLLIGGVIAIWAIMMPVGDMFPDDDHITDQGMPIRDMDNATYTWTADEIKKTLDAQTDWLTVALVFVAPGITLFYVTLAIEPSKEKLHRIGCRKTKDYKFCPECGAANKYCPECGLKLSRLERN